MTQPTSQADPEGPNPQVRSGMNPLYICGACGYTPVHHSAGPCRRCKLGDPPPYLSFIRLMGEHRLELHDVANR